MFFLGRHNGLELTFCEWSSGLIPQYDHGFFGSSQWIGQTDLYPTSTLTNGVVDRPCFFWVVTMNWKPIVISREGSCPAADDIF